MPTEPISLRLTSQTVLDPLPLAQAFPHPDRPIEIDMGCGKGRFLIARAGKSPATNYLGIDRLLGRIRKIERRAGRLGLENVRLLRMDAFYAATYLVPAASVSAYHVYFPDPWPKTRHHRHRLFNEAFMDALARTLVPAGSVHLATDHLPYFQEIVGIVRGDLRFETIPVPLPPDDERTDFELLFLGTKPIGRLSFRLRSFDIDPATGGA